MCRYGGVNGRPLIPIPVKNFDQIPVSVLKLVFWFPLKSRSAIFSIPGKI